jgi:BirA family biotin operon repressor/biotin-[acetyl-CoA-carboxylase] ligase
MTTRLQILRLLADGKLHSGAAIGRRLGISRAAVSKGVKTLGGNGLAVSAVAGRGYRLAARLTPLDRRRIAPRLAAGGGAAHRVEVLEEVESTNDHLLAQALAVSDPSGMACLAEVQSQGRGRRGKSWVSSAYQNLTLSIAWRFAVGPAMVSGLSLAAGVAVLHALEEYGLAPGRARDRASRARPRDPRRATKDMMSETIDAAAALGLKWPNDILWQGRKLAGLLVDAHGEASGPCTIVLGVGINCCIAARDARRIDQPWVDLYTITGETPDRNRLAVLVLNHLRSMFRTFAASGFAAFQTEWNRRHLYADKAVRVGRGDTYVEGTVDGIDVSGALRLRTARGEVQLFHSGEVSLRAAR